MKFKSGSGGNENVKLDEETAEPVNEQESVMKKEQKGK